MNFKIVATTGAFLYASVAFAHHTFDATYQLDREIKIEGKLIQVLIRNPHSFLHIEAPDANGVMQRWALESRSAGQLAKEGLTRDLLNPGDELSISMMPGRQPEEHRGILLSLDRKSDGFHWAERKRPKPSRDRSHS
jgi:hypothetical protein